MAGIVENKRQREHNRRRVRQQSKGLGLLGMYSRLWGWVLVYKRKYRSG